MKRSLLIPLFLFLSIGLSQSMSSNAFLAVANNGNRTVVLYALSGISSSSKPEITLYTLPYPNALAFDSEGNLWVGGGNCVASSAPFIEEFRAPLASGEQPVLFLSLPLSGQVLSLAFDAQGNLWAGEQPCQFGPPNIIQEYPLSSNGLSPVGSPLKLPNPPLKLAFDKNGNLWVSIAQQPGLLLEFLAPVSSTSETKCPFLSPLSYRRPGKRLCVCGTAARRTHSRNTSAEKQQYQSFFHALQPQYDKSASDCL